MFCSMRGVLLAGVLCTVPVGMAAQETNFANGPQYLVPAGRDAQFAQPIATPSMAVEGTYPSLQVGASNATAGNVAGAVTETLSLEPEEDLTDLYAIYYGYPPVYFVVSGGEEPGAEPATRTGFRRGLGRMMTVEDLRFFGYGTTLGEAARYAKAHRRPAQRVFTNDDLQRTKAN